MSNDLEELVATLQLLDLREAVIDELANELRPHTRGHVIQAPQLLPGMLLFRGRLCNTASKVRELSYPPPEKTQIGRLNRAGSPLFYASPSRSAVFFELGAKEGSTVLVSRWRITSPMLLNHIGYHPSVFTELGSTRSTSGWDGMTNPHDAHPASEPIWDCFARLFTERVPEGEEYKYKLSVAVAECMFGSPFAGVLYPSVAMWANADNIALHPRWADESLQFVGVERIQVQSIEEKKIHVDVLDYATSPDGVTLEWKGRGPIWSFTEEGETLRLESTGEIWRAFNEDGKEVDPQ